MSLGGLAVPALPGAQGQVFERTDVPGLPRRYLSGQTSLRWDSVTNLVDTGHVEGDLVWSPGFHASGQAAVDADAYFRYVGRWSALFLDATLAAAKIAVGNLRRGSLNEATERRSLPERSVQAADAFAKLGQVA